MEEKKSDKGYKAVDIFAGLKFYYEIFEKNLSNYYIDEYYTKMRENVLKTLLFSNNIINHKIIGNIVYYQPLMSDAIETTFLYEKSDFEHINKYKFFIISYIEALLFPAIQLIFQSFKYEISEKLIEFNKQEQIEYLIKTKYYYKNNENSFPSKLIDLVIEHIDKLILENQEYINSNQQLEMVDNQISNLIIPYLKQIEANIENNDLQLSLSTKNYKEFISKLEQMLYIPSYYDITENDREKSFHLFLLGVLKGKLNLYSIKSNQESGSGRYDIGLYPSDKRFPGIIIELKKINNKNTNLMLDQALNQINENNYAFDLKEDGINQILKIAIVFNGSKPFIKWTINNI